MVNFETWGCQFLKKRKTSGHRAVRVCTTEQRLRFCHRRVVVTIHRRRCTIFLDRRRAATRTLPQWNTVAINSTSWRGTEVSADPGYYASLTLKFGRNIVLGANPKN